MEEATLALDGFDAGPLSMSWLNWNLEMLVFWREKKTEYQEKNPWSKAITNNSTQ